MSGQLSIEDAAQELIEAAHRIMAPESAITTENDWIVVHDERFSEFRHYARFLSSAVNLQYVLSRE